MKPERIPKVLRWSKTAFQASQDLAIVFLMVLGIFTLDSLTLPRYIEGYLYIGPILYSTGRLQRWVTLSVTAIAIVLIFLNLWIPTPYNSHMPTLENRGIAALTMLLTGFLCDRNRYYQDVLTQQQGQLQAQAQLDQLRQDFASTLAHDLKTPLLGALEILRALRKEKFGGISHAQRQVLETMTRSHKTTLLFVETLLDVYRNDIHGLVLNQRPVELSALTQEVANSLGELASSREISFAFHFHPPQLPASLWVEGDALQLQRVLTNLLVNAINYSRRGDQILIEFESESEHHIVKILDTGSGLKPDDFPYLFERFYQGEGSRQAKGTGLGLYLARQIVEAHGGTIWAQNRQHSGALFGFKLPVISAPLRLNQDYVTANITR